MKSIKNKLKRREATFARLAKELALCNDIALQGKLLKKLNQVHQERCEFRDLILRQSLYQGFGSLLKKKY